MAFKNNPFRLNKLQLRTLALAQILAKNADKNEKETASGEITLTSFPYPHGDHVHIGPYIVSPRDISGFSNPSVWAILARRGLVRVESPTSITITADGMAYETGLSDKFTMPSAH